MNPTVHAEYEALRRGVGVIDLSSVGKLEVRGKNAAQFINGQVTNEVKALPPGDGVFAVFPNVQGKVVALCHVYNLGDRLLLELDASTREKIFQSLSRFVPAGDFFVADVTAGLALVSAQGPRASALIESLTGEPIAEAPPYKIGERAFGSHRALVATRPRAGGPGFDLYVTAAEAAGLRGLLLDRGRDYDARAVGEEALEIARIEAGIPREGADVREQDNPLEAGLDEAVSYTKGCYLGQEIIARIHWRGQPARRLMGLLVDGPAAPAPGTELYAADGKKVGEVTSSTSSPALGRVIALGYVHRYYLKHGTELTLGPGEPGAGRAQVAELPLVKT